MGKLLLVVLVVIWHYQVGVIGRGQPEAVQIIKTQDGRNGTKVLHYKGGSTMRDILTADDVKDLPILVYSVTGKTRGGKSFLLNLMYKYLDAEGQPNWTQGPTPKVFDFKDGADSMTKGLWLCTRIFRRTIQGRTKVGIMLMDNQGLFDGEVTGGESVAMSGVSTILSHVQMFNMKEKITTNDLEQIMLHLVPDNVEGKSSDHSTVGSSLTFVVRDFMGGRKYGFGLSNGRRYINEEQKRGTDEYQSMWADQRSVFNDVDCVLLPHPGLAVMTEEFTQSPNLKFLKSNFVSEITAFIKELFSNDKLIPHAGGMTGQKMHETLTKLDGKVADKSLSYYNMYLDRTNNIIMQTAVNNFANKLETSGDVYKAKDYMTETLATTKFKGKSSGEFESNLKKTLEDIVNSKVVLHLKNMYKSATSKADIHTGHGSVWSKVMTDFRLLLGSTSDVSQMKENIVKEMALIYYMKLAQEEGEKFKRFCEAADAQKFYDTMLSLKKYENLNTFLESNMKPCADFQRTGASVALLEEARIKQKLQFGTTVKTNILRNMYKVKEYFVQNYKRNLKTKNVETQNAVLWPRYKQIIDTLEFESESERNEHTQSITREIATYYYRLLREEVHNNLKSDWNALNNNGFHDKYEAYQDESKLNAMLKVKFPKYIQFSGQGLNEIWEREMVVLVKYAQLLIYEGLKSRGYAKESQSFWDKHGGAIIVAILNTIGAIVG